MCLAFFCHNNIIMMIFNDFIIGAVANLGMTLVFFFSKSSHGYKPGVSHYYRPEKN